MSKWVSGVLAIVATLSLQAQAQVNFSSPSFSGVRFSPPQSSFPQFSAPQFSGPQQQAPQFSTVQFSPSNFATPTHSNIQFQTPNFQTPNVGQGGGRTGGRASSVSPASPSPSVTQATRGSLDRFSRGIESLGF